jgi:putative ABC transport system permease protein
MWGRPYQVVGVMDEWHVRPRFYLINGRSGAFANDEDFVIPFRNAMQNEIPHAGGMSCSNRNDASWKSLLESECTWLMFWAELKTHRTGRNWKHFCVRISRSRKRMTDSRAKR